MKCQKLLITVLCAIALMASPMTTFACGHNSQSDGGRSSCDNNGSRGNNESSSAGNDGQVGGEATQGTQNPDANGPSENSCQYWWNWGSAKYHCPTIKGN